MGKYKNIGLDILEVLGEPAVLITLSVSAAEFVQSLDHSNELKNQTFHVLSCADGQFALETASAAALSCFPAGRMSRTVCLLYA